MNDVPIKVPQTN